MFRLFYNAFEAEIRRTTSFLDEKVQDHPENHPSNILVEAQESLFCSYFNLWPLLEPLQLKTAREQTKILTRAMIRKETETHPLAWRRNDGSSVVPPADFYGVKTVQTLELVRAKNGESNAKTTVFGNANVQKTAEKLCLRERVPPSESKKGHQKLAASPPTLRGSSGSGKSLEHMCSRFLHLGY